VTTFLGLPTAPRGVGHLRGSEPFPVAAPPGLADSQLRPQTSARPPRPSAPSGPRSSPSCRTGRSCARPAGPSRQRPCGIWTPLPGAARGPGRGARRDRPLGPGRHRGQRDRDRSHPRRRRHGGGQGQVPGHRRDRAQRRARRGGHHGVRDRSRGAHRSAREGPALAHPGPGHPPATGRRIREIFLREMGDVDPALDDNPRRWPRRPGSICGGSSSPRRSGSAGRTSPSRRPAPCASSSPRATAGCA